LAVANANCTDQSCPMGSVAILLGNGNGTFQEAVTYSSVNHDSVSVAVGDFNRDGKLDLVLANANCIGLSCDGESLAVLLGKGDGSFEAAVAYDTGSAIASSVLVADLNGDGKQDLVLSSQRVLLGNGDGTFQPPEVYSQGQEGGGSNVFSGAVADLNRDGKPDLAVAQGDGVSVLLNIARGFRYSTSTALSSSANPSSFDQLVTFIARLTPSFQGTPTGTVTFHDYGYALATIPVSSRQAKFSTTTLSTGKHSITASYSGDAKFLPSTSTLLTETVNKASSSTRLMSSPNPSRLGQQVTFTAIVSGKFGGTLTGSLVLKDGSTTLATVRLSSGKATYITSTLSKGTHTFTANYGGSSSFQSSSATLKQMVD
jgi:Bacterial Ig-like domain (group 3)/FG-GAP-like repeat